MTNYYLFYLYVQKKVCFRTYVKELLVTTISQSLGAFGFITFGLINLADLKSSLKLKKNNNIMKLQLD